MRFYLSILLVILVLFSCKKEENIVNASTIKITGFKHQDQISFENVCEYKVGNPRIIKVVDLNLFISNIRKGCDYYLYRVDLSTNEVSNGYLKKGRGPNEALSVFSMGIVDRMLWVHDITKKEIMTIDLEHLLNDSIVFKKNPVNVSPYKICLLDRSTYLACSDYSTKTKLTKENFKQRSNKVEIGTFNSIPNGVPMSAFKYEYSSNICKQPNGDKVALVYRLTDILELIDIKQDTSVAIHGPECFKVEGKRVISSTNSFFSSTQQTRRAFIRVVATEKYIYALYSGRLDPDKNSYLGNRIFVYDWNGIPIKELLLDRDVLTIEISPNDKVLYSFDVNTGYIIKTNINI